MQGIELIAHRNFFLLCAGSGSRGTECLATSFLQGTVARVAAGTCSASGIHMPLGSAIVGMTVAYDTLGVHALVQVQVNHGIGMPGSNN